MWTVVSILIGCGVALALTYSGRAWWGWVLGWIIPLVRWVAAGGSWGLAIVVIVWLGIALVTGVPDLRRRVMTGPALRRLAGWFPRVGDTERIALEAGTVWWDAELFSGNPDWDRILAFT